MGDAVWAFTGRAEGDPREAAVAAAVVAAIGGRGPLQMVRQVHGNRVVGVAGDEVEADAILSTTPGRVVAVRVADCVPILLAAPGVVAAVHAGWRGTAADIARIALAAVREASPGAEVHAVIGPCICGRCYEVGDEVIEAIARVAGGDWRQGRHVDLALANQRILEAEGVRVTRIDRCTRCDPSFWSHRRDGAAAGRQVGAIRL